MVTTSTNAIRRASATGLASSPHKFSFSLSLSLSLSLLTYQIYSTNAGTHRTIVDKVVARDD